MFNGIPNLLILLIPLAIFIGRTVFEARKKNNRAAPPAIPVHFEDDDDKKHPVNSAASAVIPFTPVRKIASDALSAGLSSSLDTDYRPVSMTSLRPVAGTAEPASVETHNQAAVPPVSPLINRLTPLKQAVVMAEILGTPKGLQ